MKLPGRLFWQGIGFGAVVILLDQLTKSWVYNMVFVSHRGYVEILPFFDLIIVRNKGVSFGLFQSKGSGKWVLLSAAVAISLALLVWLWRVDRRRLALAIGAVVGGAIGNMYDRLTFGGVIDFLDFHVLDYHWPAFNVADSAITLGVAVIILDAYLVGRAERNEEKDIVP